MGSLAAAFVAAGFVKRAVFLATAGHGDAGNRLGHTQRSIDGLDLVVVRVRASDGEKNCVIHANLPI
jgi:hypothetical protein